MHGTINGTDIITSAEASKLRLSRFTGPKNRRLGRPRMLSSANAKGFCIKLFGDICAWPPIRAAKVRPSKSRCDSGIDSAPR